MFCEALGETTTPNSTLHSFHEGTGCGLAKAVSAQSVYVSTRCKSHADLERECVADTANGSIHIPSPPPQKKKKKKGKKGKKTDARKYFIRLFPC